MLFRSLCIRGFQVDVGIVDRIEKNEEGNMIRKRLEVDFVCNRGSRRYYVQSAFVIPDREKMEQEKKSLVHISDSFKKIIVVKDRMKAWRTEDGICVMGIMDFLLRPESMDW